MLDLGLEKGKITQGRLEGQRNSSSGKADTEFRMWVSRKEKQ